MSFNDGFNIRAVPWPPNTPVSGNSLVYNGTQWIAADVSGSGGGGTGDITAVNAGTNMTGGGASGDVTISLSSSVTGLTNVQTTNLTASNINVAGTDLLNFKFDQVVLVAKNGNDSTGTGSPNKPYLTLSGAMASITDATPTKRYAICVAAGDYTESGNFDIKPNVFIIGQQRDVVKISATSFRMSSLFNAGGVDNRSGFSNCTLLNSCNFDWNTVQSSAGKLYFNSVSFNSTVTLNGYNNSIAQAQFDSCLFFDTFTVSGINVGRHVNNSHFNTISLNQHASLPTILVVAGGDSGNVTLTTTVNNFGRRCALFARNFWMAGLTVDGISSYADVTDSSLPSAGPTVLNSGNIVYINPGSVNKDLSNLNYPTAVNNPIIPAATNATNMGDWGKEWFWNFAYVFASTGNELYITTYSSSFGADSSGKDIWIVPDGAGLTTNANGGNVILQTATTTGTGTRGVVQIDARMLELSASTSLSGNVLYSPANSSHWNPQPTTIKEAIDRIAAAIYALSGNNPIT